jgi:hypothetical protein
MTTPAGLNRQLAAASGGTSRTLCC